MITHPWILKCGEADETVLLQLIAGYLEGGRAVLLAGCTDRYVAGVAENGSRPDFNPARLLELRLFREDSELWAHRSAVGSPFSWRIADDNALKDNVKDLTPGFFASADNYRVERVQRLDADPSASGAGSLMTLGGGRYSLPVTDEDTIRVVTYLDYDENGIARAVDVRMKGFELEGGNRA